MKKEINNRNSIINTSIGGLKKTKGNTTFEDKNEDYKPIRVGFVGLCGVGKTSIIQRFVNNSFSLKYDPTIDVKKYVAFKDLNNEEEDITELAYIVIED